MGGNCLSQVVQERGLFCPLFLFCGGCMVLAAIILLVIFYIVAIIFVWSLVIVAGRRTPKPWDDDENSERFE